MSDYTLYLTDIDKDLLKRIKSVMGKYRCEVTDTSYDEDIEFWYKSCSWTWSWSSYDGSGWINLDYTDKPIHLDGLQDMITEMYHMQDEIYNLIYEYKGW